MNELPKIDGGFGCILADPPWSFLTYGKKRTTPHRGAAEHYSVMRASELRDLPVLGSASKNCLLFMWAVGSHYDEAIDLGRAWGFRFITGDVFVWVKTFEHNGQMGFFQPEPKARMSMGYWSRKQSETCMLFSRGKPRRLSKGVRQVIFAPRREHSRKPDEQYGRIEALASGPYLEIFARQSRPGWTVWGDQSDKFDARSA